ncbi:unnamed protein product [Lampetra fluviatilis]
MSGGDRSLRLLPGLHRSVSDNGVPNIWGKAETRFSAGGPSQESQWRNLAQRVIAADAETPTEGAGDPVDRPVITEPTTRDHPTPIGRIQEDVGCAFPGLDDEQLRRTQQRDLDLAAVEAALWEKKSTLPEPRSGSYVRVPVEETLHPKDSAGARFVL